MIEGQEGVTWEQWVALARACEEAGIEALFRSDHYISFLRGDDNGSLDAWATLTALAAITSTLRLGTLVSPATFRHPSELAKVAATADHVSRGRIEFGLGAGWNQREHEAYGFPFPDLAERLEVFTEQLEVIHRQWTEDTFDFKGRHYELKDSTALPKPVQKPRPPIIVGGRGRRGTVIPAARYADEYNTVYLSPADFAEFRARVARLCEEHGRDPATMTYSLMTFYAVGEERLRKLHGIVGQDKDFDTWLAEARETALVGTRDEVAARIREYEAAGCERIMLQHLLHEDVEAVLEIGRELVPALA
jgi:F420-dependent oxidoreductase-like protein